MLYSIHEKNLIERYLRQNPFLHLYELGDLDDFFWQHTNWYAMVEHGTITQLALLYLGAPSAVLLGLTDEPAAMRALLQEVRPILPLHFHAHLSQDVARVFTADYTLASSGLHYKMALTDPACLAQVETSHVEALAPNHLAEIEVLYQQSYPHNSFDPRMLETGYFYGIRHAGELVSIAGVHVYSATYNAAAIGNVTTRPDMRGRGLGTQTCAKLCQQLLHTTDHIGLNVKADNLAALASYRKLGFTHYANYEEYDMQYSRFALLMPD